MERSSPLTQRVRRLLGTRELVVGPTIVRSRAAPPGDTSALFENQLAQLSSTVAELRAVDRRRDAELRALRSLVHDADDRALGLNAVLDELDELIRVGRTLLDTPAEPAQLTTLFERMRARMGSSRLDTRQHEVLAELVARLTNMRELVRACLPVEPR